MARKFLVAIDMSKLEILNPVAHKSAGAVGSPVEGQFWFDTTAQKLTVRGSAATYGLVRDGGDLTTGSVAITALATDPRARSTHTGTQVASTISDFDTQVRTNRLDQMAAPTADVSLNSRKITGLAAPTASSDAANKQYVDDAVAGLSWKDEVRVATTAAGTLASSFANGQTVDGVTLATGERILIKNQASQTENGIYVVQASGAPVRAADADTGTELSGAAVFVREGTTNGGTRWVSSVTGAITIGVTNITFANFGGGSTYVAGSGLTESPAGTFNVGAGTGISVAADAVAVDTAVVVRKHTALIGNNSNTSIAVTHSLGNQWVSAMVIEVATLEQVECDIDYTDANTTTFIFAVAPATNALRVIIQG
jgi:hypothetical protein